MDKKECPSYIYIVLTDPDPLDRTDPPAKLCGLPTTDPRTTENFFFYLDSPL